MSGSKLLVNPSAERNKGPILEILKKYLRPNDSGSVLEISSGTGQHVSHFAPHFPNLIFQPSEYDRTMLSHIKTYADNQKNIKNPLHINICEAHTSWNLTSETFDYIININMIHITPFICTEGLFRNGSALLKPLGLLFTYGPYGNNGIIEPESNVRFDQMLRAQNADWGVRDISVLKELAYANQIDLHAMHDMPANNKILVWRKQSS